MLKGERGRNGGYGSTKCGDKENSHPNGFPGPPQDEWPQAGGRFAERGPRGEGEPPGALGLVLVSGQFHGGSRSSEVAASEFLTWRNQSDTKFPLFQVRSAECGARNGADKVGDKVKFSLTLPSPRGRGRTAWPVRVGGLSPIPPLAFLCGQIRKSESGSGFPVGHDVVHVLGERWGRGGTRPYRGVAS
jgi:hypothetical protein